MKLERIQVQQFRNLQDVSLNPTAGLNVIYGANGSGKSSFLEAIHYLGFARSFRSAKHQNVIQHLQDSFTVFCKAKDEKEYEASIGYQRFRNGDFLARVNGEALSRSSDLVRLLPVQLFTPSSTDVIYGAPSLRRKFLDWGLFHVEQSFLSVAGRFQQVLSQRNALLRGGGIHSQEATFWNAAFADCGEHLDRLRTDYVEALKPNILANLSYFLPEFSFEISYHSGWERGKPLAEVLKQNLQKDIKFGYSSSGPHKADLRIKADGIIAQEVLSRGQVRMLMAALLLSQSQYLLQQKGRSCIFLLDDIGAELDSGKREAFVKALLDSSAQIFVTAVEKQQVAFLEGYTDKKMFHVEHGQVKEE
ncbi:DNA replication/repair protein RecF [Bowmanella denitrificans]|uniref:DNA replication and repair protein RecF n=1 Tax=Bowmanella denitrificans TaxID=366582 RepID=A0ABN0XUA8_9ALTE